jgi:DNA-binding CsgD family transcriptional regulator
MIIVSLLTAMLLFLVMLWGRLFSPLVQYVTSAEGALPVQPAPTMEKLIVQYGFTLRETEVLRLLLADKKTNEIAEILSVAESTAYKYISSMLKKTRTENRLELIAVFSEAKN